MLLSLLRIVVIVVGHGFLLSGGSFSTIDFPGAVQGTVAGEINDRGQIVGNFGDVSGITHGFLLSAGNFSTVDFPGAFLTEAVRMNEVGFGSDIEYFDEITMLKA